MLARLEVSTPKTERFLPGDAQGSGLWDSAHLFGGQGRQEGHPWSCGLAPMGPEHIQCWVGMRGGGPRGCSGCGQMTGLEPCSQTH